jgi:glycosyltransferase involved in cell wall biosynthesis
VLSAGYLDTADLRRLVAGAALLAYPSVYEGFGLPPLEAFAAGVPVVARDLPVVREVTGELATLAPVGDAAALAAAVRAALAGPGDPAARRDRARGFTWAACAARTAEAYRLALAG